MKTARKQEIQIQIFIGLLLAVFFILGKSFQVIDSNFNFLLSHQIYQNHSTNIKPILDHPEWQEVVALQSSVGVIRKNRIGQADETWQLTYPQMPIYLNIPFVWLIEKLGWTIVSTQAPFWMTHTEHYFQKVWGSLLMALYAVLLYRVARLWLNQNQAAFIILPLVLGSAIASTLSRATWSDTWATLWVMFALHHLSFVHHRRSSLRPFYLVGILALAFFCKPVYALSAGAAILWMLGLIYREDPQVRSLIKNPKIIASAILGFLLLGGFYAWSIPLYGGSILSNYSFAFFSHFDWDFLWGQFFAPSRGMLIFWSWMIPLAFASIALWQKIAREDRQVIFISLLPLIAIVGILSFYPQWHGGFAYGPRLNIPALPWLSLIAIIVFASWSQENKKDSATPSQHPILGKPFTVFSMFCILWAVLINVYGVIQPKTFYAWHKVAPPKPANPQQPWSTSDKQYQQVFWNWSDPIFLAGIVKPERYLNFVVESVDPARAELLMEQIQTKQDMIDFATGKRPLITTPSMNPPSSAPSPVPIMPK